MLEVRQKRRDGPLSIANNKISILLARTTLVLPVIDAYQGSIVGSIMPLFAIHDLVAHPGSNRASTWASPSTCRIQMRLKLELARGERG